MDAVGQVKKHIMIVNDNIKMIVMNVLVVILLKYVVIIMQMNVNINFVNYLKKSILILIQMMKVLLISLSGGSPGNYGFY